MMMHSVILRTLGRVRRGLLMAGVALPCIAMSQVAFESAELAEEEVEEIRRYTVEMIVFEYAESAVSGNEVFPPDELPEDELLFPLLPPSYGDPGTTVDSGLPVHGAESSDQDGLEFLLPEEEQVLEQLPSHILHTQLKVLDPERYAMKDIYQKLVKLDAYKPIMRAAWTQATYEKDQTLPISLRRLGNAPLRLNGSLTLYLSRYLHLVVDLTIEAEQPPTGRRNDGRTRYYGDSRSRGNFGYAYERQSTSINYTISEDRIFRSGETRYYDHPRFGVVARITRFEEEVLETDEMYLLPGN